MKITKESRTAFLATMLGDGYIDKTGSSGITHSKIQLPYLQWKKEYLESFGIKCSSIRYVDNNGYGAFKFGIRTYKFSKLYRRILYKGGRKSIGIRKLLDKLDAIHIAIWYMDDGGLSKKKNKDGKVVANDLMLNTHLSKEENQIIIDYFLEVWDVRFTQVKNKGWYRLRCGTKEARKFLDLVRSFVEPFTFFSHKLDIKSDSVIPKGSRRPSVAEAHSIRHDNGRMKR